MLFFVSTNFFPHFADWIRLDQSLESFRFFSFLDFFDSLNCCDPETLKNDALPAMGETKEKRLEHSTFSTALEDTDWSFETIHETMHSGTFHFEVWLLAGALNPWPIFRKRRSHQCDCSCGSTKLPVFCLERKAAVSLERAPSLGETLCFDFDAFDAFATLWHIVTVHRRAVLCWFTLEVPGLPYERALPQGNLGVDGVVLMVLPNLCDVGVTWCHLYFSHSLSFLPVSVSSLLYLPVLHFSLLILRN